MPAEVIPLTADKDNDDHGFPEKAGDFRKATAILFDVVIAAVGFVFDEVPYLGAITWILGKINTIGNKGTMDATLDQYLHAVTGSLGKDMAAITDKIDSGFKQLNKQLEATDYQQVVHDRAMLLGSHMKDVINSKTESKSTEQMETAVKDFLNQCYRMPPIDVLYALYKRISKSQSDINFIWAAIIAEDYHHAAFEPYKQQVQQTMVSLVLSHMLYISLEYENTRNADLLESRDDEDEILRLFEIARDINRSLDDIDTQRQEVWWPKTAELFVRSELPKGGQNGKDAEERIIFNLMKNFGPWYDFVAIQFTPVTRDGQDRYDWRLQAHGDVKNIEIDVGGTKCIVLRFLKSITIKGNNDFILDEIGNQLGTFKELDKNPSEETTMDQVLEHLNKMDKSEPWFALAIRYRPAQGSWAGAIGNQKLNWQATNQSRLIHRTFTTSYLVHVEFGMGQQGQTWTNNVEIFISNTR